MTTTFPRSADLEVLGLQFDADKLRSRFELVPAVARHDGSLYGGTAIAASVAAMEAGTGRPALWITTQYISTSQQSDLIDCTTQVMANGRNISQVQVTGTTGDRVLFVSLGSTAIPRPDGYTGQFQQMPAVSPPVDSGPLTFGPPASFRGFTRQVEYREATVLDSETGPQLALWARLSDGHSFTPATLAFVADMVPGAIARTAGKVGGGTSLDNSLRFGIVPDGEEWVLLELRAHMSGGAHAHGSVCVWSSDGRFLAVGSQSANMIHMMSIEDLERMRAS